MNVSLSRARFNKAIDSNFNSFSLSFLHIARRLSTVEESGRLKSPRRFFYKAGHFESRKRERENDTGASSRRKKELATNDRLSPNARALEERERVETLNKSRKRNPLSPRFTHTPTHNMIIITRKHPRAQTFYYFFGASFSSSSSSSFQSVYT